jgi:peptidoglycan hydrolase-like protein with peptidoglycan-binding domain
MKRILLATAATIALSLPAMAQGQQPTDQNQNTQQPMDQNQTNQMNNQSGSSQMGGGSSPDTQQQASQRINPSNLSQDQIMQIQQALSQKGIDVKSDGKWGPDTRAALRKFQQQNNLQGNGQLDEQTLAQLGVNVQGGGQGTVGSGSGANGTMNQGSGSMGQGSGSSPGAGQNRMSPSDNQPGSKSQRY